MAKPDSQERAEHILNAIQLIRSFVWYVNEADFLTDVKLQSAVQYQFLIIGEAVRHIGDDILAKYKYPWHIPRSFRNFIIHEYHGIKMERIFYATQDLGELEKQVKLILEKEF
ncbi:MAG: HepT-like ribonuclease domain-containing protein [Chitinophagaceae bacterium]